MPSRRGGIRSDAVFIMERRCSGGVGHDQMGNGAGLKPGLSRKSYCGSPVCDRRTEVGLLVGVGRALTGVDPAKDRDAGVQQVLLGDVLRHANVPL